MSNTTELVIYDSTVNPVMGCDGCELWQTDSRSCYAGRLHEKNPNATGFAKQFEKPETFDGRVWEAASWSDLSNTERPSKPWLNNHRRTIFISDMGDAFSKKVEIDWLVKEVIAPILSEKGQRHEWFWSTRRPRRAMDLLYRLQGIGMKWPDNLMLMTSATNRLDAMIRLPWLTRMGDEGVRTGIFLEPMLEDIDISAWMPDLQWVVVGGMTGPESAPVPHGRIASVVRQCENNGTPVFFKQWGDWVPETEMDITPMRLKKQDAKIMEGQRYYCWKIQPATLHFKHYVEMPFELPSKQGVLI
jgi:protein gp37